MSQLDSLLDLSLFGKNMQFAFDDKCTVGIFVLEKYLNKLNFKYLSEVLKNKYKTQQMYSRTT